MIFIDCETLPSAKGPNPAAEGAPSNYKDPEKIAEYVNTKALETWAKSSTDVMAAQLLCIGVADTESEEVFLDEEPNELKVLMRTWEWVKKRYPDDSPGAPRPVWVGHNSLRFDFRMIGLRALRCGLIDFARSILPARYQDHTHKDTAAALGDQFISLDAAAAFFGIERNNPIHGSQVQKLYGLGRTAEIREHCFDDIRTTRTLALKLREGGLL